MERAGRNHENHIFKRSAFVDPQTLENLYFRQGYPGWQSWGFEKVGTVGKKLLAIFGLENG